MVMESFEWMFEGFMSLCIIGRIVVQYFSYVLMIYLEVVDRGSTQHKNPLELIMSIQRLSF
jgi:hypothetical protein